MHKPIKCGGCGTEILPALGKLDQAGLPLEAAVYECKNGNCEWSRIVKLDLSQGSAAVEV